jgi:hypothetical protein
MTESCIRGGKKLQGNVDTAEAPCGGPAFFPLSPCLSPVSVCQHEGIQRERSTPAPKFVCIRCHRPDQGLHSGAYICSAVLCVAAQRTRRARCGGAHPAFSPAKLKLPHSKRAVDQGLSTTVKMGPAGIKSTNSCMPTRAAIDARERVTRHARTGHELSSPLTNKLRRRRLSARWGWPLRRDDEPQTASQQAIRQASKQASEKKECQQEGREQRRRRLAYAVGPEQLYSTWRCPLLQEARC